MEIFETWNSLESMQKKDIIHILNLKFIFLFLLVLKYIFVQLSFLLNTPVSLCFPIAIYICIQRYQWRLQVINVTQTHRQWDMPPPETHHALFCENNVNRFYCANFMLTDRLPVSKVATPWRGVCFGSLQFLIKFIICIIQSLRRILASFFFKC